MAEGEKVEIPGFPVFFLWFFSFGVIEFGAGKKKVIGKYLCSQCILANGDDSFRPQKWKKTTRLYMNKVILK